MLAEEAEEVELILSRLLMVERMSSRGRVIIRSTSSGDEEGYGTCTVSPGNDKSGIISKGSFTMEMIPMVTKISITTITDTGFFIANWGRFVSLFFLLSQEKGRV